MSNYLCVKTNELTLFFENIVRNANQSNKLSSLVALINICLK